MWHPLNHDGDLIEMLIEGGNPYAERPLTDGEQARLKQEGLDPAALDALVVGRVVLAGRGAWALAGDRVVLMGQRYAYSVDAIDLDDIEHAERETGRYGDTVRLQTRHGRWAMYGVQGQRAAEWVARVSSRIAAHA